MHLVRSRNTAYFQFSKYIYVGFLLVFCVVVSAQSFPRERISINDGWRFMRYESGADSLFYDERPVVTFHNDNVVADTRANQNGYAVNSTSALKKWVLPSANEFIKDAAMHHVRPAGNPGADFPFVSAGFNDKNWQKIDLPHDWAIQGPFYQDPNPVVGGGMGRLPSQGVAWYRKKLEIPDTDAGKKIFLDIDGAMSYAIVWLNGKLVGGWPYGYNSFRLDLTPYVKFGEENQIAIRLDNPNFSSRWYPGGGIYRNVWLVKTNQVYVDHWGTTVTTTNISTESAHLKLAVKVKNESNTVKHVQLKTDVFLVFSNSKRKKVESFPEVAADINSENEESVETAVELQKPQLWEPLPAKKHNMYVAVTQLYYDGKLADSYETPFGIRDVQFDAEKGVLVNGKAIRIQGANQHHDLGALGAAFNVRAAQRQLEILAEAGCNAIRLSHNPPAPELLDLTDKMGFLVIDEVYDCWEKGKNPLDFHLIFPDWYEADARSFVRRDKNHPSVVLWSFGNEVGEQYLDEAGAVIAKKLHDIVKDEDPTRLTTASMNYAKPDMPFSAVMDVISLNYQGEGIRDAAAYAHLKGIHTSPLYPAFHQKFPDKTIVSSETASALSTRGTYLFPVTEGNSAPVEEGAGGDAAKQIVSAYELYTAPFGASPDKVFSSQDKHPFVAGEFVWSGWDYLGEPTPYYTARSSYSGFIDLAGFKKDRFYLYQSRWMPEKRMVHILPHWNWPDRVGLVTPVHVFTSGDEVELFLNGKSLGKKKKGDFEYRLRWDDVKYEPGTLKAVAYKNGKKWAEESVSTTGAPAKLKLVADRKCIKADGEDLSFITLSVTDEKGQVVPNANNHITFTVEGAGELVATDNGDPADLHSFGSPERDSYSGLALVIVKGIKGKSGNVRITAAAPGLESTEIMIKSR